MFKFSAYCVFLILSVNDVFSEELTCDLIHSVNITGGVKYANGSIFHNNLEYSKEHYAYINEMILPDNSRRTVGEHIRGCICNLKGSKPCIPLCCSPGFIKKGDFESSCESSDHELFLSPNNTYNHEEINVKENYEIVQAVKCNRMFYLEDEDEWTILKNGSLSFESDINHFGQFCLDNILGPEDENKPKIQVSICFEQEDEKPEKSFNEHFADVGVMMVSILFLILTLLVYAFVPKLRNLRGKTLMCYMIALCTFFTWLCIIKLDLLESPAICTTYGYLSYGTLLMAMFFLNAINFDVFLSFCFTGFREENKPRLIYIYLLYGIGGALMFVLMAAIMDNTEITQLKPRFGIYSCFLHGDRVVTFWYFYLITSILLMINIVFVVTSFLKMRQFSKKNQLEQETFYHIMALFLVMDCAWIMEVITWFFKDHISTEIIEVADFIGHSQGIWIFVFCIFRQKNIKMIKQRFSNNNDTHL